MLSYFPEAALTLGLARAAGVTQAAVQRVAKASLSSDGALYGDTPKKVLDAVK
jgi:hypothetical protein